MVVLNLVNREDSNVSYKLNRFPDGEVMFEFTAKLDRKESMHIICRIKSAEDLFILLQIGDILNRHGIEFELSILYLMSMRMDRVMDFNRPYNLQIVSNLINSIKPRKVKIIEPHSDKTTLLLQNSEGIPTTGSIPIEELNPSTVICFPDKGAYDRYITEVFPHLEKCFCEKERDMLGALVGFNLKKGLINFNERHILVIDDLCDGGGTFIGVGELLKKEPIGKLSIFITHAIQKQGLEKLSKMYDEIFITNSYHDWDIEELPENVKVIKII